MGTFSGFFKGFGKTIKSGAKKVGRGAKAYGKRFAKDFVRRLAAGFNLDLENGDQGDVRDYKRSLAFAGLSRQQNVIDEPSLETPEVESNISNPSISSINDQLKKILKTAKAIGLVQKKTQDLAMQQLKESNRIAKESQLETPGPDAVPVQPTGNGSEISPLADSMQSLIGAFQDLISTVRDKINQQGSSGLPVMPGGSRRRGGGRGRGLGRDLPEVKKRASSPIAETTKTGATRFRDAATGRFTTAPEAAAKPGILGRLAGKVKESKPVAAAIAKTAAVGGLATSATSKIAGGIKAGKGAVVKGAELTGQALKSVIIKVAGPKVAKAIGQTAIKSIPILGTIAGLGFAASRLVEGDYVGAGLDAVSGLAGPATAIPAMVLSLARDIYSGVFGVQPETDPQFGERMTVVKSTVQEVVENQLGKKIVPKDNVTGLPEKKAPEPQAVRQTASAPASQTITNPPPAPAPSSAATPMTDEAASTSTTAPAAAPPVPASPPKVDTGSGSSPSSPGATDGSTTAPVVQSQPSLSNPDVGGKPAVSVTPTTLTGAQIAAATDAADNAGVAKPKIGRATVAMRPATKPTTKTGARGMGNVPEPTYTGMGKIANQLYFSASI